MKKYTKEEAIRELADHVYIDAAPKFGYCTWKITSHLNGERGDTPMEVSMLTHEEEDFTGLFDGPKYNPLLGLDSQEELEALAAERGMTVKELQDYYWYNGTVEDNYEPREERDLRLAKKLYDEWFEGQDEVMVGEQDDDEE